MSRNAMPKIAARAPLPIDVEAGEAYRWCACGRRKTQPFCAGSHKGSRASRRRSNMGRPGTTEAFFCACTRRGKKPLADGTQSRV